MFAARCRALALLVAAARLRLINATLPAPQTPDRSG